jgi:hypothetical protein
MSNEITRNEYFEGMFNIDQVQHDLERAVYKFAGVEGGNCYKELIKVMERKNDTK